MPSRLDAIRKRLEAAMDGEAGIAPHDLRDLLTLVDALQRERDCRRYGAESTTMIDAIRDTDKVLSRLDAEVEG